MPLGLDPDAADRTFEYRVGRRPGSLDAVDDETYEIAFVADNPAIWMDHCPNLPTPRRA